MSRRKTVPRYQIGKSVFLLDQGVFQFDDLCQVLQWKRPSYHAVVVIGQPTANCSEVQDQMTGDITIVQNEYLAYTRDQALRKLDTIIDLHRQQLLELQETVHTALRHVDTSRHRLMTEPSKCKKVIMWEDEEQG